MNCPKRQKSAKSSLQSTTFCALRWSGQTSPLTGSVANHAQAWQQDRLDLAAHFFAKVHSEGVRPASADIEKCIDVLYEIGKDNLEKKNNELATTWLERAATMFEDYELGDLGPDAGDLRLNVLHTYGRYIRLVTSLKDHV